MRYLSCEIKPTTKSGKELDDLRLNARVVAKCRYDLEGKLNGRD